MFHNNNLNVLVVRHNTSDHNFDLTNASPISREQDSLRRNAL